MLKTSKCKYVWWKNNFSLDLEKFCDTSLINCAQEKDLNNLVATRKHQKNPEKLPIFCLAKIFTLPKSLPFLLWQSSLCELSCKLIIIKANIAYNNDAIMTLNHVKKFVYRFFKCFGLLVQITTGMSI